MKNTYKKITYIYCYIKALIIFQIINNSQYTEISLNNIISLGGQNLRYSRFSFNSNGDMVIDTTSFPVDKNRYFFGLKQNGKFYFKNSDNSETPFYTMTVDHEKGRIEGESYFIKLSSNDNNIHGKESICGISKLGDSERGYYVEIYNLESKTFTKFRTSEMFGKIATDYFVITKTPDESNTNFYYLVSYLEHSTSKYNNYIKKLYFPFSTSQTYTYTNLDTNELYTYSHSSRYYCGSGNPCRNTPW